MLANCQVVHEDAKEQFLSASLVRPGAQRRAQLPLVLGEGAFDMNSVLVNVLWEPALQLATIPGRRPLASAARVDGDHQGADSDLATELMMRFAVIGHVGEDAVPVDSHRAIEKSRRKLGGVVAGALTHRRGDPQVAGGVAENGQLGECGSEERLRVGSFVSVVNADVAGFVPRSVDRPFGLGFDQAAAVGSIADRIEESIESPFFKSRL